MRLRARARVVQTPSGQQWRVGRSWISRRLPRWRRVRVGEASGEALLSIPDGGSLDDLGVALLVAVGALVVAVILIPLLLFGIELILLGLAIAAGILGRGLLGRPWVVRATPHDNPAGALTWKVAGLKRSARVIDEVSSALSSGLDPSPSEAAELVRAAE
jgi:hypothetical protein